MIAKLEHGFPVTQQTLSIVHRSGSQKIQRSPSISCRQLDAQLQEDARLDDKTSHNNDKKESVGVQEHAHNGDKSKIEEDIAHPPKEYDTCLLIDLDVAFSMSFRMC